MPIFRYGLLKINLIYQPRYLGMLQLVCGDDPIARNLVTVIAVTIIRTGKAQNQVKILTNEVRQLVTIVQLDQGIKATDPTVVDSWFFLSNIGTISQLFNIYPTILFPGIIKQDQVSVWHRLGSITCHPTNDVNGVVLRIRYEGIN